jgi:hypothetical protein
VVVGKPGLLNSILCGVPALAKSQLPTCLHAMATPKRTDYNSGAGLTGFGLSDQLKSARARPFDERLDQRRRG